MSISSLRQAVKNGHDAKDCPFYTYIVEGKQRASFEGDKIQVGYAGKSGTPYWQWEKKEKMLEGDALKRQLEVWVKYGTIEQDAAEAVKVSEERERARERERCFSFYFFFNGISHSLFFLSSPPLFLLSSPPLFPSSLSLLSPSLSFSLSFSPKRCVDQPEKYCNLLEHTFVILGATSAMGPIDVLLRYGATVIAIDIDREPTWNFLLNKVRNSPGRLVMPVLKSKVDADDDDVQTFLDGLFVEKPATPKMLRCGPVMYDLAKANSDTKKSLLGCNLLEETPSISRWLRDCVEDENVVLNKQKMTVGNYTYLDGELHVRLSVACNEIILHLCQDNAHIKIAFLCTPTDCHLIPKVAYQAAEMNLQNAPWWM